MKNNDREILVVGAGPTGLAAAAVFAKQGQKVRIIDKNPGRSDKTKALGVQVGTLNCLEAALDPELVRKMIETGQPTRFGFAHIDDHAPIRLELGDIPGDRKFILILSQSETERFLEEYCASHGVKIERNAEILDFKDTGDAVEAKIRHANGRTEEGTYSYLIGCDGAHSTVRQTLAMPFKGASYAGDFILGDVKIEWPWETGVIRIFLNERGTIAAFPLDQEGRYRLIIVLKDASPEFRSEISESEFRAVVNDIAEGKIKVKDSIWLTRFRVHHRVVSHLRKGRIFLAGDAAHIHSPVGAQGMNTGIQDAINLSFKLIRVLRGEEPESLLDRYEKERLPVIKDVVHYTDLAFKAALTHENILVKAMRKYVMPKVMRTSWIRKKVVAAISEIRVAEREIARYPTT